MYWYISCHKPVLASNTLANGNFQLPTAKALSALAFSKAYFSYFLMFCWLRAGAQTLPRLASAIPTNALEFWIKYMLHKPHVASVRIFSYPHFLAF